MDKTNKNPQDDADTKAKTSNKTTTSIISTKKAPLRPLSNNEEQLSTDNKETKVDGFLEDSDSDDCYFSSESSSSKTIDAGLIHKERFSKKLRIKLPKPKHKSSSKSIMILDEAERFEPDVLTGLSLEQVENRNQKGLINYSKKKSTRPIWQIFFYNLVTPINAIAAFVAIMLLIFNAHWLQLVFMFIILANNGIGIFQEIRAKITIEKLSIMTAPTATVIRAGERSVIPVEEVVLDDIIYIEAGKQICADSIVVSGEAEANEAMLTGESQPERKIIGSTLYSGSYISSGNCYARVNKVGSANYVETLTSHAKRYKKPKSELFNSINTIMRVVIPLAIFLTAITVVTYWLREIQGNELIYSRDAWDENIQQAAGVMMGMLPVGMFLLTSIALFVSVRKLGKKRALVKDFNCIESLARVDMLCLDKTGTITDGTMSVKDVIEIKGASEIPFEIADIIGSILTATGDNNQTARALAEHFGYSKMLTPTTILPFSSSRKLAGISTEEAGTFLYGAPEFVLKDVGVRVDKIINEYAREGYRVLCLAHSPAGIVGDRLPSTRRALCIIAIEDSIREDAIETVAWFKKNNVAVKVISGDNPITVSEVARRVGVEKAELYVSLEGLSEREVLEAATKYTVFGRVTPEQKKLLIQTLKQKGHTVAMTGDGVNDILAMRESDCAIAIASGSEAARNVAHLVLQDSNFNSMPSVVLEGRKVINNIQKTSSLFLMKTIMTVILAVVFLFLEGGYPYLTHYLLLMEMFVIAVASFALALQPNNKQIKGQFLSNVLGRSAPGGITLAVSMLAIYFFNQNLMYYGNYMDYYMDISRIDDAYNTMLILGVTFTSFIVLVKICEPPDSYRAIMLVGVGALLFIGAFAFPRIPIPGFSLDIYNYLLQTSDILFLIATVLGSYFFMSILIRIMKGLKVLNY